jgi:hypothetical protein
VPEKSDPKQQQHRTVLDRLLDAIGAWSIVAFVIISYIVASMSSTETCRDRDSSKCNRASYWLLLLSILLATAVVLLKVRKYVKEAANDQAAILEASGDPKRLSVRKAVVSKLRDTVTSGQKRDYVVDEKEIHELIESVREYKTFVDRTQFNYKATFASRFSEAGYKGASRTQVTGRHGIYAWLGSLEGNHQPLKPIQSFLVKLDESAEAQRWASVQSVKPLYEFCLKTNAATGSSGQSPADSFASVRSLSMRDASTNPLLMGLGEDEFVDDTPLEQYVTLIGTGTHGLHLAGDMTIAAIEVGSAAGCTPDMTVFKSNGLVLVSLDDVLLNEHENPAQAIDDAWDSQAGQPERKITLGFNEKQRVPFKDAVREVVLRKDDVPHEWRRTVDFAKDRSVRAVNLDDDPFKEEDESLQILKEREDSELQRVQEERLVLIAIDGEPVENSSHDQLKTQLDEHFDVAKRPGSEVVLSFGKPTREWYDHLNFATLRHSMELIVVGGIDRAGNKWDGYPRSVFFILTRLYIVGESMPCVHTQHCDAL